MTALDLIQGLSQALYVLVFVLATWRYLRDPTPAHLDMALFFAILAFFVVETRIVALLGVTAPLWFTDILIVTILAAAASLFAEPDRTLLAGIGQVLGLLSALAFFVGFTPPPFLRRAWQAPELRDLLTRAASLPRLPTTIDIVRELERGAAGATGASARIGLWPEDEAVIRFWPDNSEPSDIAPGQHIAGRAFEQQRTLFSADPIKDDPQGAERYRRNRVGAVIGAPVTAGGRRLGVLVLYAERPPIFAASDREVTQLLADQAAVILESRALIDHASRVRAREEATRMKEDFLSAAAHDLKTPLTTVVAQAQFLERKAQRDPSAPSDVQGLQRIVREAQRLAALVTDLLDAARLEQGRLVVEREPVDLGALVSEVVTRQHAGRHSTELDVRGVVVGTVDRRRIEQLRSEEHTSELQSHSDLVCRLL